MDVDQGYGRHLALQERRIESSVLSQEVLAKPADQDVDERTGWAYGQVVPALGQKLNVVLGVDVDMEDNEEVLQTFATTLMRSDPRFNAGSRVDSFWAVPARCLGNSNCHSGSVAMVLRSIKSPQDKIPEPWLVGYSLRGLFELTIIVLN